MTNYTDRQGKLYLPYDLVMGKGPLAAPPFVSILAKLDETPRPTPERYQCNIE